MRNVEWAMVNYAARISVSCGGQRMRVRCGAKTNRPTPYAHSLTDLVTRHQTSRLSLFWGIGGQVRFRKFARKLDMVFARIPTDSGHEVGRGDAIAHQKPHPVFAEDFHDCSNRNLLSHHCRTAGAFTTHGLQFVVKPQMNV